jgi:hypothetical protein
VVKTADSSSCTNLGDCLVKQIYNAARTRFNLNPEKVDERSNNRFGKPAFELSLEEANEFFERITSSRPRPTQS